MQTAKWPLRVSAALWLATTCCAAEAVDLRDLAWLTGIWRGEMGGATTEEVWSAPMGDNMTCMYRIVQDGRVRMYEFMTLEMRGDKTVLFMRHVGPGNIGREEKDAPLEWAITSHRSKEVVFERADAARHYQSS